MSCISGYSLLLTLPLALIIISLVIIGIAPIIMGG